MTSDELLDQADIDNPDWSIFPENFFDPCNYPHDISPRNISKHQSLMGLWSILSEKEKGISPKIVDKTGNYRKLKSFQNSEIVFDLTVDFIKKYISPKSRTRDQMEQAARSGKHDSTCYPASVRLGRRR